MCVVSKRCGEKRRPRFGKQTKARQISALPSQQSFLPSLSDIQIKLSHPCDLIPYGLRLFKLPFTSTARMKREHERGYPYYFTWDELGIRMHKQAMIKTVSNSRSRPNQGIIPLSMLFRLHWFFVSSHIQQVLTAASSQWRPHDLEGERRATKKWRVGWLLGWWVARC